MEARVNLTDRLSKTRFTKGLRCPRALYLSVHSYELATPPSVELQARFDVGHLVGKLAQRRYPGGVLIAEDHLHHREALESTRRALADGAPALYEAAFTHDNVKIRADVLRRLPDGGFELIEVKSTGGYDEKKHLPDAAVQHYVCLGCGVDVRKVSLMHLNKDYVWHGGEYDPRHLLTPTDITRESTSCIGSVPDRISEMMRVLALPGPPERPAGVSCTNPYECEFSAWCNGDAPQPDLSAPIVTDAAVLKRLDELVFPLHFVDFETLMPALPMFRGTRPFQTSRVQWSIHTLHEDGELEHSEWLMDDASVCPDHEFARSLFDALPDEGTFIHYSAYECTQLVDIACRYPEFRQLLADRIPGYYPTLTKRLAERGIADDVRRPDGGGLLDFDLGVRVVKDGCLHPVFGSTGRGWSIKPAIKILAPHLPPYEALAVSDGNQAMAATAEMLAPETDPVRRAQIRQDLLAYCAQDTMAMVEVYRTLTRMRADA